MPAKTKTPKTAPTPPVFRVGDLVTCPAVPANRYEGPTFVEKMDARVGQTARVESVGSGNDWIRLAGWSYNWLPKWLAHVGSKAAVARREARARERRAAAALRRLKPAARRAHLLMASDRSMFGCQRAHVRRLVEAIVGCALPPDEG
jgi:hypothetical protein